MAKLSVASVGQNSQESSASSDLSTYGYEAEVVSGVYEEDSQLGLSCAGNENIDSDLRSDFEDGEGREVMETGTSNDDYVDWDLAGHDSDDGSTNSNNNDDSNDGHSDAFRQFVTEAVLKLVEIRGDAGFSIKTCEDILKWGKDIHSQRDENAGGKWPLSWVYCLALLQDVGYKSATLYWICLDECHPCLYGLMEQKDEACPHCGKKAPSRITT